MTAKYSKLPKACVKLNITTPHKMRFVKDKWFLACLCVPVLLAFAGWDTHQILGQTLQCVLWNISVRMEKLNVYKSFWSMLGFKGPWSQFTSCINISCFQGVVHSYYLSLLLMLPPQRMHFVHRLSAPYLQRLRFQRWSKVLETGSLGEHSGHSLPSLLYTHLGDWFTLVYSSLGLYYSPCFCYLCCGGSELTVENMSSSVYPSPSVLLQCPKY